MGRDQSLSEVEIFLNVADLNLRSSISSVLRNLGIHKVHKADSLAELSTHLEQETPDLLICSTHFPDGDLFPKLHELRHHKWGLNPFVPIMTVTNDPSADLVKLVLESGADDLLVQPISTNQLLSRINGLAKNRKQFVVTTDYVGPTRRSSNHKRGMEIPMIDVPNTLRTKITGEEETVNLADAIVSAVSEINEQKVERHGYQLAYLAVRIVDPKQVDRLLEGSGPILDKLIDVADKTRQRMTTTKYAHTSTLCASLLTVAHKIRNAGEHPSAKDLELMMQLVKAIQLGFADSGAANVAAAIANTVANAE